MNLIYKTSIYMTYQKTEQTFVCKLIFNNDNYNKDTNK
jgi:hypothetical protein